MTLLRRQTRREEIYDLRLSTTIGEGRGFGQQQRIYMSGDMPVNETIFIY